MYRAGSNTSEQFDLALSFPPLAAQSFVIEVVTGRARKVELERVKSPVLPYVQPGFVCWAREKVAISLP